MTDQKLKPGEAEVALDSVDKMQRAGFGHASPPRWFGIGIALIVATGFALYALEDPGNSPALFMTLGMVLFIGASRQKMAVLGKNLPDTRTGMWALAGVSAFLLALFFGGIVIRRAFDIAWVPLLTGAIAGTTIYLLSESERRYNQSKAAGGID